MAISDRDCPHLDRTEALDIFMTYVPDSNMQTRKGQETFFDLIPEPGGAPPSLSAVAKAFGVEERSMQSLDRKWRRRKITIGDILKDNISPEPYRALELGTEFEKQLLADYVKDMADIKMAQPQEAVAGMLYELLQLRKKFRKLPLNSREQAFLESCQEGVQMPTTSWFRRWEKMYDVPTPCKAKIQDAKRAACYTDSTARAHFGRLDQELEKAGFIVRHGKYRGYIRKESKVILKPGLSLYYHPSFISLPRCSSTPTLYPLSHYPTHAGSKD